MAEPTLDDLWDELQRGRIYQCSLPHSREHVEGVQDGENIYIDIRPAILEVLIHELVHRRHPRMSERRVLRSSRSVFLHMSDADKTKWWRAYQRIKRTTRPLMTEDAEEPK